MALSRAVPSKSEGFRRFLLGSAGVLFALVLIECPALLNLYDYSEDGLLSNLRPDPELLFLHRPDSFFAGSRRGGSFANIYSIPPSDMSLYRWDVRYDHNGFRNDADLRKADVAVTGSSFVEATTISDAQLMTTLLAQRQRVVVANLGHNAYGPQQQLIVLKRYGLPLQPRTVVWMFADFTDLRQATVFDGLTHYPRDYWHAFFQRSFTRKVFRTLRSVVLYAAEVAKGIFAKGHTPKSVSLAGVVTDSKGRRRTMYFHYAAQPLSGDDFRGLALTKKALEEAHRLCVLRGTRLLVVFVPEKFRVYHAVAQFPQNSETRKWILNDMPQRLGSMVASISPGIGYLDLTPMLVEAAKRGVISYYTDDSHWSPEGHQIAAEAIGQYLSETDSHSPTPDRVFESNWSGAGK